MIPDFVEIQGVSWRVLPPGIHLATLKEIENRCCFTVRRQRLFSGLLKGAAHFFNAGCPSLYLDGSFVTEKPNPNDYDCGWEAQGVDPKLLDTIFLLNDRKKQKEQYGGEYFSINWLAAFGRTYLDFFQIEKESGNKKGIIRIDK